MRISISRREPVGSEFAGVVHFWRRHCRSAALKYARNLEKGAEAVEASVFWREQKRQEELNEALISQQGSENPITIWKELGEIMTEHVTVTRINKNLESANAKLGDLQARYRKINLSDRTRWSNQTLNFARSWATC